MGRHYAGQAVKQLYVLVLGLDVLGNPFGLLRGMAEGMEDLFYEPYQVSSFSKKSFCCLKLNTYSRKQVSAAGDVRYK